ncbi:zinc ABC transporter substrate-binding protein [Enhydrobacter sp.]|jgi:zinc/manganese transport system substrate-binding protein|uniref:metal ABC transporter solute-binding protein, Zn/Mn family n=1 Tax=Enhydrobacter sp. TaxID=1894999 RepID=UPI002634F6CF|nr:zinc ABC transporter substrate-binding protein [Enhydrobacter sp.]WIM10848.1 MAG: Zinc ABC transporter, substrate-binding protein ZnuA [Enhydrobacter sp.]
MRPAFLALLFLFAAGPAWAETRLRAVATFSILADFVAEVGGDRVEVSSIVRPDTDVHTYQPRPRDARLLAAAQVLVSNGLGFEGWLDRLAEAASFKGRRIVASAGAPTAKDPHCWQDVSCARRYVANIADGLAAADPEDAAYYRGRAADYDKTLARLDAWIRAEIADVPADRRKAITGHDSFEYFARAYGVRFAAPRGYNSASEPTARDMAALIREVRAQKIKALFVENLTNPALIDEIARDAGATVGPPLYSDALSRPGGPAATYEAMMRYNVTALVAGMKKN